MRILFIECNTGAAGDMLAGAFYDLLDESGKSAVLNAIGKLGGVIAEFKPDIKSGIKGTHFDVSILHNGEHHHEGEKNSHHKHSHDDSHSHNSYADIQSQLNSLELSEKVKFDALSIYKIIANAESKVHGQPVEQIHFHEVGELDARADIIACAVAINELKPDMIYCSPITTGYGSVKSAHGEIPVPAPATTEILCGIPVKSGNIEAELCTPTGAAILKHFTAKFSQMPEMVIEKTGIGTGFKDFEKANIVRAFIGETSENAESVTEISCNIDDMTGEAIGFAMNSLFDAGALDVYSTNIIMKKSRPGLILTCICQSVRKKEFAELMLKHTTTFGVRVRDFDRMTLNREVIETDSPYGKVRVKRGYGYNVEKVKAEYEDIAKLAQKHNVSIETIKNSLNTGILLHGKF